MRSDRERAAMQRQGAPREIRPSARAARRARGGDGPIREDEAMCHLLRAFSLVQRGRPDLAVSKWHSRATSVRVAPGTCSLGGLSRRKQGEDSDETADYRTHGGQAAEITFRRCGCGCAGGFCRLQRPGGPRRGFQLDGDVSASTTTNAGGQQNVDDTRPRRREQILPQGFRDFNEDLQHDRQHHVRQQHLREHPGWRSRPGGQRNES